MSLQGQRVPGPAQQGAAGLGSFRAPGASPMHAPSPVYFVEGSTPIQHLGVLVGRDPAANAEAAYAALIEHMQGRARRHMRIDRGFHGRAHLRGPFHGQPSVLLCFPTTTPAPACMHVCHCVFSKLSTFPQ